MLDSDFAEQTEALHRKGSKRLISLVFTLFKLAILVVVAWWISGKFPSINYGDLLFIIERHWLTIGFACILFWSRQLWLALRWSVALKTFGFYIKTINLLKYQLLCNFIDIIIPIPDSEDFYKVVRMRASGVSVSSGTAIIIYDRIVAISSLLILMPASLFFYLEVMNALVVALMLSISFCLLLILIFRQKVIGQLVSLFCHIPGVLPEHFTALVKVSKQPISLKSFIMLLGLNILKITSSLFVVLLLTSIFGFQPTWLEVLVMLPVFHFSVMIPISYQGLGLYEGAMILLLTYIGMDQQSAVFAGIIHFCMNLSVILLGGILFLLTKVGGSDA
jgi:glycosyltransferase 2 family protein